MNSLLDVDFTETVLMCHSLRCLDAENDAVSVYKYKVDTIKLISEKRQLTNGPIG